MDESEIDTWLEAVRLRDLDKKLDFLNSVPFHSLQLDSKKLLATLRAETKKMSLALKVGLGLNEVAEQDKKEFKEAMKNSAGKLRKGKPLVTDNPQK